MNHHLALEISHLNKTYKNGVRAVIDMNLKVNQGDFFALLGPNGAGKSTTIGIISSLVNKSSGTIKIFGHDLEKDTYNAKRCIGVVPQEINLFIFEKVEDVLLFQAGYYGIPHKIAKRRTEYYLKALGLWNKRDEPVRALSGGMKRRLLIARALIHEPKLLILDEPTAGVDIEIRHAVWEFVKKLNAQGTTIILTTHYLEEAENLCKNIAIINHGRIVTNTSVSALLQQLNSETFVLNVQEPLLNLPHLPEYQIAKVDDYTLEVEVTKTQGMNHLFTELSKQNISVLSLRNKVNRLEELFLRFTRQHPHEPT